MICDCFKFREDLVNWSRNILIKRDEKSQWEVFEQFCTKYKRKRSQRSFPYENKFCSKQICSFLSRKLAALSRRDMVLSTFLVDLLTILHLDIICSRRSVRRLWNDTSFSRDREALKLIRGLTCLWGTDFMKLLLNFGFLSSLPIDSPHLKVALEEEFATLISDMAGYNSDIDDFFSLQESVMELLIKGNIYQIRGRENCKRMFLVTVALRGVQISLRDDEDLTIDEFIGCLRMYFSGTRDALISVFEVRSILYASLLLINRLDLFDAYCQEFDKLIPECPAVTEPRKLTHLARYHIRETLSIRRLPLPLAVDKLLLPNILKDFLLGEISDVSRNSSNVLSQKCVTRSQLELMIPG